MNQLEILWNLPFKTRKFSSGPPISGFEITQLNILKVRKMFVLIFSHAYHITTQIITMMIEVSVVALILLIKL